MVANAGRAAFKISTSGFALSSLIATAASSMLAITGSLPAVATSIPVLPVAARCGHDEAISGQLLECLVDPRLCVQTHLISPLVVPGLFFVVFPKLLASVSSTQ